MVNMDRFYYLCSMTFLQLLQRNGETIFICPVTMTNQTHFDEIAVQENTQATFSYHLEDETRAYVNDDVFAIEIKLCENGSYHGLCKCRSMFDNNIFCKNQRNFVTCDVYNSEILLSLLVKRTYSDIIWELYRQDSTPRVIKLTTLQVTYLAKVTGLKVNGREVNETVVIDENQEVSVSCSFINGKPPVSVRMLDQTGNAHSSTRHGRSPLTLSLGEFRCQDVWPTIRCEAPGSELNRSVAVLGRCLPQFSHTETQVLSLVKVLEEGMTLGLKSYTSNIRKCHMNKLSPQPARSEVKCNLSGSAPDFNLTLLFPVESRIGEGIWTLHVITELGSANITFVLINNTGQFGDRGPVMTTGNSRLRTSE
ncbi:uncharacterized protein LOC112567459 [Pomacea canaliculata]|uniref:uncharacterized protein LOC112567459 n=1 Tax=Pomacea canaliculata TaxID=400727 RepID=UPI000D73F023|nr:uncharacterized protein LOC112567459 [Pomacea canaliculata]